MRNSKILVVDDSRDVHLMATSLLGQKFEMKCVFTAEEAQVELAKSTYSLIILDIGLPGEDGFKLCANLQTEERYRQIPIVFLTGKRETRDKVMAFSLGADDYLVKPLDPQELQVRIESKMRRLENSLGERHRYRNGPFTVALEEQKIYMSLQGSLRDLGLSSIEFKLLYYFLRHDDHVLSREQILNEVWGPSTHITDRAVDTYVYNLRKKMGNWSSILQSVPRVGYRMSLSETAKAG